MSRNEFYDNEFETLLSKDVPLITKYYLYCDRFGELNRKIQFNILM